MSKIKIFVFSIGVLVLLIILGSCETKEVRKITYFDGEIVAEWEGDSFIGSRDFLNIYFYEEGTYQLLFNGKSNQRSKLPKDTVVNINDVPRVKIFEVPYRFQLTIRRGEKSESHKFPPTRH